MVTKSDNQDFVVVGGQETADDVSHGLFDASRVNDTKGVIARLVRTGAISSYDAFAKKLYACMHRAMDFDGSVFSIAKAEVDNIGSVAVAFTSYGHEFELRRDMGSDNIRHAALALQLTGSQQVALGLLSGVPVFGRAARAGEEEIDIAAGRLLRVAGSDSFGVMGSSPWQLLAITEKCQLYPRDVGVAGDELVHPVYVKQGLLAQRVSVSDYFELSRLFSAGLFDANVAAPSSTSRSSSDVGDIGWVQRFIQKELSVVVNDPVLMAYADKPSVPLPPADAEYRRKAVLAGNAIVRSHCTVMMSQCSAFTSGDINTFVTGVLTTAGVAKVLRGSAFFKAAGAEWVALDNRRLTDMFYMLVDVVHKTVSGDESRVVEFIWVLCDNGLYRTTDGRCIACGFTESEGHTSGPACKLLF